MTDPHVLLLPSWYPTPDNPVNGIFFAEQARALKDAGLKVGVVAPIQRGVTQLRAGDIGKYRYSLDIREEAGIPTFRSLGWALPRCWRVNRLAWLAQAERLVAAYVRQQGKPDLIHAHATIWGGIAAQRASQSLGVPYLVTEHSTLFARGTIPGWQRPEVAAALAQASARIAVSRALADRLADYVPGLPVEAIPNIVDTGSFTPPSAPRDADPFTFLSVSVLAPKKGIHLLLEAFAARFRGDSGVVLRVGGDGPERRRLERRATELGIAGQVRFLGMLSRTEVREEMWRANAFVLPSYFETFGIVFIEAMATGLPVIGTRCGGPEEIITPETGLLVPVGDAEALGGAMQTLKENHVRYETGGISRTAETRYGTAAIVSRLRETYRRILAGERGGR